MTRSELGYSKFHAGESKAQSGEDEVNCSLCPQLAGMAGLRTHPQGKGAWKEKPARKAPR